MPPAASGILGFLLPVLALGSNGTPSLTWDTCDGPLLKSTTAPEVSSLVVSVSGATQPIIGYQFSVIYADANSTVPDAWRFDPVGCQTQSVVEFPEIPWAAIAKACPAWPDTSQSVFIPDLDFTEYERYASTTMRIWVGQYWLSGQNPASSLPPDPAKRYFLGAVRFAHTISVTGPTGEGTCGGYETPMCFKLTRAIWLDGSLNEQWWFSGPAQTITFNDPTPGGSCAGTPVRSTTWGQIRSQYRR